MSDDFQKAWEGSRDGAFQMLRLGYFELDMDVKTGRTWFGLTSPLHFETHGDTEKVRKLDALHFVYAGLIGLVTEFEIEAAKLGVSLEVRDDQRAYRPEADSKKTHH